MTEQTAAYIEAVANGTLPSPDSEERRAYDQWSKDRGSVTGSWAEWKYLEIQSRANTDPRAGA
jgi:hypothetical protein